ncbi:MAG: 16S rRNA (uracil(1498)-N(3))-methyltransferase [Deltaproteobacteria bacterium]|nr:16S rRNA (uracil(1498)-N(3))-methyltransferase [Deltaproteobacteria bacterium]
MPQFPIPPGQNPGTIVTLSREDSKHLVRVLRASVGERIGLFDGACRFEGEIVVLSPVGTEVRLLKSVPIKPVQGEVVLCQSLLKGEKMEWVIQKAVELGASAVISFKSERSIPTSFKQEKIGRWQKIADEALKQSGRVNPMRVHWEEDFSSLVRKTAIGSKIIFSEKGKTLPVDSHKRNYSLFVGPEGGFSDQEISLAKEEGCEVVSLGSRTLRAETASLVSLTLVQHELGNI